MNLSLSNCQSLYPPCERSSSQAEGRIDGREHKEMRSALFKTGVVADASGSAYVEIGETKVICSIRGPRAAQRAGGSFSDSRGNKIIM